VKVSGNRQLTAPDLGQYGSEVRQRSDPPHAGPRINVSDSRTPRQLPGKEREVDSGAPPQRMPAPGARIDIQELVFARARIAFEFHFDEPGVVNLG